MATGVTLTNTKTGKKAFFPKEIVHLLQMASQDYRSDAKGMAEGGECLTSSFVSYCDINTMECKMNESGQAYKNTAAGYASIYNRLFEIDC